MAYTLDEYFSYAKQIESEKSISNTYYSSVNEFPDGFKLTDFISTADTYLNTHSFIEFLTNGVYKAFITTLDMCLYTYDLDDYAENKNFDHFLVYKNMYLPYQQWELNNDCASLCDSIAEEIRMIESARTEFNRIKQEVCNLPIEHALLIATLTERWHAEIGGTCHECDDPPLNVAYVIENNHNYQNATTSTNLKLILGIDTDLTAVEMLDYVERITSAINQEVSAYPLDGISFD